MEELKAFLREQLRNAYTSRKARWDQIPSHLMREPERFFYPPAVDTSLARSNLQAMDARVNRWAARLRRRKIPDRIQETRATTCSSTMNDFDAPQCLIYSMFNVPARMENSPAVATG